MLVAVLLLLATEVCSGFVPLSSKFGGRNLVRYRQSQEDKTSSYVTSDASSKGIVSSLTGLVNFVMTPNTKDEGRDGKIRCDAFVLTAFPFSHQHPRHYGSSDTCTTTILGYGTHESHSR